MIKKAAVVLLFALFAMPSFSADDPEIQKLMTEEEFSASGLGKLSKAELDVINRWLIRYTAEDAPEMLTSSPAVKEIEESDIESQIDGAFSGWNGPTQFPLKNGQLWETQSTRQYSYSAVDPEVIITRNFIGTYRMRIVETGKAISVRRVR